MNEKDPLYWDDAFPIALVLRDAHPDLDPTTISPDTLHSWVITIPGFADDPQARYADQLEAILTEWVDLPELRVAPRK
jgi:FeS assembly protein IscX